MSWAGSASAFPIWLLQRLHRFNADNLPPTDAGITCASVRCVNGASARGTVRQTMHADQTRRLSSAPRVDGVRDCRTVTFRFSNGTVVTLSPVDAKNLRGAAWAGSRLNAVTILDAGDTDVNLRRAPIRYTRARARSMGVRARVPPS
jgi:hypothetical protein